MATDRWVCLYCGNKHLNYIGPCVICKTPQGQSKPPSTDLPDRSVLRDAYLQLEAASRRLRAAALEMDLSWRGVNAMQHEAAAKQLIGEAKALLYAAEARL